MTFDGSAVGEAGGLLAGDVLFTVGFEVHRPRQNVLDVEECVALEADRN